MLLRVMVLLLKLKNEESKPRDAVAFGKLTLILIWSTPLRVNCEIPFPVNVIDWDL